MMGERLAFQKKNGQKIAGKAYFAGVDKKYPTVIFAHGFGSNYRDLEHHGAGFAESGINCIFFDFCGGGLKSLSDGKMTQMTVLTEAEDLIEVISQVQQMENVDSDQLFIQGESDNCVPISYSEHAEKVYDNVKLIRISSAGHGFDGKDSQFAREQSIEFIKKNLKQNFNY